MGQHIATFNNCCVTPSDEENDEISDSKKSEELSEKCDTPDGSEILQIYKKLSDFDGKWMNDQGQRFEVRGGMVLANINGRKIEQKMLVDEEQCIFILEEPNGSPNLWSMPMNSEPVWSDGSKPIKWVRVETQNIPDGEAGGNHAPIEAVSDFDGKWKNDYGQEFEIKDGMISMKHKGKIVKDTITFDETKEVFKLAGNTWTMPLKGDTLWSDGVWSVKWTRIEELAIAQSPLVDDSDEVNQFPEVKCQTPLADGFDEPEDLLNFVDNTTTPGLQLSQRTFLEADPPSLKTEKVSRERIVSFSKPQIPTEI